MEWAGPSLIVQMPKGVGGLVDYNAGWGDGSLPIILVVLPVIVFVVWFELKRRKDRQ